MPGRLERQGSPVGGKRLLFRAPIWLYRARLGFLLGHRFLLLEHTGHKSGLLRQTVLEVVSDDPDAVYVAAASGTRAQWLANVRANPLVAVTLGSRRFSTKAEALTPDEAKVVMARYAEVHPKALQRLAAFMLDDPGDSPSEKAARVAAAIPMLRLPKPRETLAFPGRSA